MNTPTPEPKAVQNLRSKVVSIATHGMGIIPWPENNEIIFYIDTLKDVNGKLEIERDEARANYALAHQGLGEHVVACGELMRDRDEWKLKCINWMDMEPRLDRANAELTQLRKCCDNLANDLICNGYRKTNSLGLLNHSTLPHVLAAKADNKTKL